MQLKMHTNLHGHDVHDVQLTINQQLAHIMCCILGEYLSAERPKVRAPARLTTRTQMARVGIARMWRRLNRLVIWTRCYLAGLLYISRVVRF